MYMQKRGQVTLFVILGIVLVSVFSFAFFVRGFFVQNQLEKEAEQLVSDFIQTNSINYYVSNCLERVSNEAMKKISLHGGVFDVSGDLGVDYIQYTHLGEVHNLTYGLVPNNFCEAVSSYQNTPDYPFPHNSLVPLGFLSDLVGGTYESYCFHSRAKRSGFFGYQSLPALCDPLGENSFTSTGHLGLRCQPGDEGFPREDTIQWKLQDYISDRLLECVDFSFYEDKGHSIELNEEGVSSSVIYGHDTTTVVAQFPFRVSIRGNEPFVVNKDFSYTSEIRLRQIYQFVSELLEKDAREYFFDKSASYTTLSSFDPLFSVSFHQNACNDCYAPPFGIGTDHGILDDVIRVEDSGSIIDNEPLVFHTAIKDRLPALDYIHPNVPDLEFDVSVIQGETITLTPDGYDPDDTGVSYVYAGWKEDEDSFFDPSCCIPSPTGGDICTNFDDCFTILPGEPHAWTTSSEFLATQKDASYVTTVNDIGEHTVRISAISDEDGVDFQDVKVFIYDLPLAEFTLDNGFVNLNNEYASLEDPYFFDASASKASIMGGEDISSFRWRALWDASGYLTTVDHDDPLFVVPDDYWTPTDILSIRNQPLLQTGLFDVELTVVSGEFVSDPFSLTLDVQSCIPFRNRDGSGNIVEYSYPYSPSGSNSFSYDHTCCEGTILPNGQMSGGTYSSVSTVCFEHTDYGYAGDALQGGFRVLYSLNGHPGLLGAVARDYSHTMLNNFDLFPASEQNDVYKRTFERMCGGDRGNVCGGAITEFIQPHILCDDYDLAFGEDERCSGPASFVSSGAPASCTNYGPGDTFETGFGHNALGGGLADGLCNNNERCFQTQNANYKTDGIIGPGSLPFKFSCVSECDGLGGCTKTANCYCSLGCGAVCDDPNDFVYDTSNPSNPTCSYGCDLTSTCNYVQTVTCNSHCIDDPSGAGCQPEHDPSVNEECYSSTSPCSAGGCALTNPVENLRAGYCDVCTPSGSAQGNYCPAAGTVDGNLCYYGSRTCSGFLCGLSTGFMPLCNPGEIEFCHPVTGPTCVIP